MRKVFIGLLTILPLTAFSDESMKFNATEISKHYAALPNLYQLDSVTQEKITDKITRQYIMGSQSMIVKWTLKKDALISLHIHPNEQITWITKGSVRVLSQGK